jgi:hypothetical protein
MYGVLSVTRTDECIRARHSLETVETDGPMPLNGWPNRCSAKLLTGDAMNVLTLGRNRLKIDIRLERRADKQVDPQAAALDRIARKAALADRERWESRMYSEKGLVR